jgi:protein-L-isoaspartate(D-aspartate) O-methyltransferase
MLQALGLERGERVLEVGTGTGFFAACLAELAGAVESLEIHEGLAQGARATLAALGYGRVRVQTGDVFGLSLPPGYDAIVLTGSLPVYDPRFERALAVGGRLFAIVGLPPVMEARLVTRTAADAWLAETVLETCIEPLVNASPAPHFLF